MRKIIRYVEAEVISAHLERCLVRPEASLSSVGAKHMSVAELANIVLQYLLREGF